MKYLKHLILTFIKRRIWTVALTAVLYIFAAFLAMLPARLIQQLIDEALLQYDIRKLWLFAGLLLACYLLKIYCSYISSKKMILLGNSLLKEIKTELFNKLLLMDLSFFTEYDSGYINTRVEETENLDALFSTPMLSLCTSILELIFAIIMLWSIDWKILLVFSIPIPFLCWFAILSARKMNAQIQQTLETAASYSGKIQDTLRGMEQVKSQGIEKNETEKIDQYNTRALDNQRKQSLFVNGFGSSINLAGNIVTVLVYLIGGIFFIRKDLSMGAFIAVSTYVGKLYSPILGFAGISIQIQPALVSLKRVSELFFKEQYTPGSDKTVSEITKIEFRNVSFQYKSGSNVLNNVNFTMHKGEKVQIVGENGSGKSTLMRLLVRLIEPSNGEIFVNNTSIHEIEKSELLRQIVYIPQKYYLFNESVEYNITYGSTEMDTNEYQTVLNELGLNSIADNLKKSGDERIGENGSRLSGGEKQKIAIARVFLLNPSLVVLDESLSGIDQRTRKFILQKIRQSKSAWIIIDHQHDLSEEGFMPVNLANIQGS